MTICTVTKTGIYVKNSLHKRKKVDSYIPWLNYTARISNGVTLFDFLNPIFAAHEEYSRVFHSHLGGFPLEHWLDEWGKDFVPDHRGDKLKTQGLEVFWYVDDCDDEIYIESLFHGYGIDLNDGLETKISIAYSPLYRLKNLPLILNTKVHFFSKIREFTIYDVVSAILSEISCSGSPDYRNRKAKELSDIVAGIFENERGENS